MTEGTVAQDGSKPRIGLIAENDLNRHLLTGLLSEAGYELTFSLDTARLAKKFAVSGNALDEQVDAWLVDMTAQEIQRTLDLLVENSAAPLLVNDDIPPLQDILAHQYWKRRLVEKLELVAVCNTTEKPAMAPVAADVERVWVLAASFGGPEAVREFLEALPAQLPIAMVYGQHIETRFDQVLASAIAADHNYGIRLIRGSSQLSTGEVAVVPVDRQIRFLTQGRIVETRKPWAGQYQPALDQIIAELARAYRERLGVIIFSGMCSDGEIGCRVAKACGSTVWVQSPDSCMSPDMPNAALRTGSVSFQGTPVELANALAERVARQVRNNKISTLLHRAT